jgi:hypothetical protein
VKGFGDIVSRYLKQTYAFRMAQATEIAEKYLRGGVPRSQVRELLFASGFQDVADDVMENLGEGEDKRRGD